MTGFYLFLLAIVLAYPIGLATVFADVRAAFQGRQYVQAGLASITLAITSAAWLLLAAITADGLI